MELAEIYGMIDGIQYRLHSSIMAEVNEFRDKYGMDNDTSQCHIRSLLRANEIIRETIHTIQKEIGHDSK